MSTSAGAPLPIEEVDARAGRGALRQLGAVLTKSRRLKTRRPCALCIELFLPIFLFVLLALVRASVTKTTRGPDYFSEWCMMTTPGSLCEGSQKTASSFSRAILYSPHTNTSDVETVMGLVQAKVETTRGVSAGTLDSLFIGFGSEEDLVAYAIANPNSVYLGVVFPSTNLSSSLNVAYTIRPPSNKCRDTTLQYPDWDVQGPFTSARYWDSWAPTMQDLIDRSIIELRSGRSTSDIFLNIERFPHPEYIADDFIGAISTTLPLFMTLAWIYTVSLMTKSVVAEKESRLKEAMMMMGMRPFVLWLGWFITSVIVTTVSILFITLIIKFGKIMPNSSFGPVFVSFLLFSFATVALSYLLSVFFSRARIAAAVAGLIYFCSYLPYIFVERGLRDFSKTTVSLAALVSTTNFGIGSSYIARWEELGIGLHWHNVNQSPFLGQSFTMVDVFAFYIIDAILYLVLAWYISAVWPGQIGVPRPWYFPLQRSYWSLSSAQANAVAPDTTDAKAADSTVKMLAHESPASSTGSSSSNTHTDTHTPGEVGEVGAVTFEKLNTTRPIGVRIVNLKKVYPSNGTVALRDVSLDLYQGHVTALLGTNGAGKTTTMSIMTGLYPSTSGDVFINGHSVTHNIAAARDSLGLCPQYNTLFDLLTVREHLEFFATIKGVPDGDIAAEVSLMLRMVDLEEKSSSRAHELSGGMMRRLSVGIAFLGGSKVVVLDEPTAGVDPSARRQIWDIITTFRKMGRTILLSTHHMDEADVLADRIAMLAHGRLQCVGSSIFLKHHFGAGYQVVIQRIVSPLSQQQQQQQQQQGVNDDADTPLDDSTAPVTELAPLVYANEIMLPFFRKHGAEGTVHSALGREITFVLPHEHKSRYGAIFRDFDETKTQLGVEHYSLSSTSLEEVFLVVARDAAAQAEEEERERIHAEERRRRTSVWARLFPSCVKTSSRLTDDDSMIATTSAGRSESIAMRDLSAANKNKSTAALLADGAATDAVQHEVLLRSQTTRALLGESAAAAVSAAAPAVKPAVRGMQWRARQFRALIAKRFHHNRRDKKGFVSQFLVPAFFVCIAMALATIYPPPTDWPPLTYSPGMISGASIVPYAVLPGLVDPVAQFSTGMLNMQTQYATAALGGPLTVNDVSLEVSTNTTQWIADNYYSMEEQTFTVFSGANASELSGGATAAPSMLAKGYFLNLAWHSPLLVVNEWWSATVYPRFMGANPEQARITLTEHPLPKTSSQLVDENDESGINLVIAVNLIIAFSFIPASFSLFLVSERVSKGKVLQFIAGVNTEIYWLSSYVWDMVLFSLSMFLCVFFVWVFNIEAFRANIGYVIALFFMYGLSMTPLMYFLSRFFSVPSTAYVSLVVLNIFVGIGTSTATFVLDFFPDQPHLVNANKYLQWVFLVFPNYAMGRGIMDISYTYNLNKVGNQFGVYQLSGHAVSDFVITGRNLLFMAITAVVFAALVLFTEKWSMRRRVACSKADAAAIAESQADREGLEDADVLAERQHVAELVSGHRLGAYAVVIDQMSRVYRRGKKEKVAVNRLTVGVARGECFGLLGVNGAGKTSTFRMLTGDLAVTEGDAWIDGHAIRSDAHFRQALGYCPQFDALNELLTGREVLTMYARLRGVADEADVAAMVDWGLDKLQLRLFADRACGTYSGGNKRKLQVAAALVGSTRGVLLLDEPSSGMDPKAQRFLWDVLLSVRAQGTSVIVTSHSMPEMEALSTRMCIMHNGVLRCLGTLAHLKSLYGQGNQLICKSHTSEGLIKIKAHLQSELPDSEILDEHETQLELRVPVASAPVGRLFAAIDHETIRELVEDYSVSQVTLDQIFVHFARDSDRSNF